MSAAKLFDGLAGYVLAMQVDGVKRATKYIAKDLVVKVSLKGYGKKRPRMGSRTIEAVCTVGRPNYAERKFIKQCDKAGEPLPVKKVQLKHWSKV